MKRICLPKDKRDDLKRALKNGDIDIAKLYTMTGKERNQLFKKYVGDSSNLVNAKMEQAMLSNQKKALSNAINDMVNLKEPIRRDMMKKVERVKKFMEPDEQLGFLDDLVETKLGLRVTEKESATILKLKDDVDDLLTKVDLDSPRGSESRMSYGLALDRFKVHMGDLMVDANKITAKERLKLTNMGRNVVD